MSPPRSLRGRLQTTTFLAVLVGYGVLLVLSQGLQVLQRRAAHAQLVEALRGELVNGRSDPAPGRPLRLPGGDELQVVEPTRQHPPRLEGDGQQRWLVSTSVVPRPGGGSAGLQVRQNVTAALEAERRGQFLLLAVAGFSSLVTSALLRPVLRAGLQEPLEVFSQALAAAEADASEPLRIPPAGQPAELRPIVTAFNALQGRLAASWEQQRTFIDGVAHELRTPITLISGYAQRLERLLPADPAQPATDPLLHASRGIHSEADRMTSLVRDLLDLARRDSGRLVLQLETLDAGEALLASYERLEGLARGRLRLRAPEPEADLLVRADPDRLAQCLANLVENALKYAPAPSPVELGVERRGDQVVLCVRDQGPGVAPEEREGIFQLFSRGSA
ncbi:MAG: sensor histidine kinase, partial [Prochlorococcaceae cyanobacterium]